jgi:hypothetical protein
MAHNVPRCIVAALVAMSIAIFAPGAAAQVAEQNEGPAPGEAPFPEGFRASGGAYTAIAEALGASASEAREKARGAALELLFRALGKDRLFAEVFVGSPPVGLSFALLSSEAEASGVRARLELRVDDESIRIVERGPYLAAAVALLDEAEKASEQAEARAAQGEAAESEARLGDALVAYGMAEDASRKGSVLLESLGDSSIFSSSKRTAPELRRALGATRDSAVAGVGRVRAAQALLATNAADAATAEAVRRAEEAADRAGAFLADSQDIVAEPSAYGAERLSSLRDRLAFERRSLADAVAALERAKAARSEESGYRADELEYARQRLASADEALERAYRAIDREIRDPAARRAARARAFRWAFLHGPTERLSFRGYLPFAISPDDASGVESRPFDFAASAECAFAVGQGGIWARSRAWSAATHLIAAEERLVRQSFDLGFGGRTLFFAGYGWDWLREVGEERLPKTGLIELGMGGVSTPGSGEARLRKADWLLALSYEIPYDTDGFFLWNVLNAGLEAQFRLGDLALIEASLSQRLHRVSEADDFCSVFSWSVGFGLRLPPPFLWGAEYGQSFSRPLRSDGSLGPSDSASGGAFRFYIGYTL